MRVDPGTKGKTSEYPRRFLLVINPKRRTAHRAGEIRSLYPKAAEDRNFVIQGSCETAGLAKIQHNQES